MRLALALVLVASAAPLTAPLVPRASGQSAKIEVVIPPTMSAQDWPTVTTANLLLSVLDMFGVHQDKIGDDSTGRLAGLV